VPDGPPFLIGTPLQRYRKITKRRTGTVERRSVIILSARPARCACPTKDLPRSSSASGSHLSTGGGRDLGDPNPKDCSLTPSYQQTSPTAFLDSACFNAYVMGVSRIEKLHRGINVRRHRGVPPSPGGATVTRSGGNVTSVGPKEITTVTADPWGTDALPAG
jgi:hypothetical protein